MIVKIILEHAVDFRSSVLVRTIP
uniref:Uncharacterized protein n=1 Tax=Anguilla anguilla TaxID=7936 RepID=A0A0E9VMX3_ANGAN